MSRKNRNKPQAPEQPTEAEQPQADAPEQPTEAEQPQANAPEQPTEAEQPEDAQSMGSRPAAELVAHLQDTGTGADKLAVCAEIIDATDGTAGELAEAMQADSRIPQGTMNKVCQWFGIDPRVLQQQ